MKLFLGNIPMGDVQGPSIKPGEFFPRLVGFAIRCADDVSSAGNIEYTLANGAIIPLADIKPIYVPLVRVSRRAGQVLIEVNNKERPIAYITLQAKKPYLQVFRFPWEEWDREET